MIVLRIARSILAGIPFVLMVILFGLTVIVTSPFSWGKALADRLLLIWSRTSLWLFGVPAHRRGDKALPSTGAILLFNHTSHLDILAIHSFFPSIRFGAKIELFKIPIFGQAMRAAGALPIARKQRDQTLKVYKQAQKRLLEGQQFILAPEGGRQEDETLGAFKSGPFIFAIEAGVPLVPIVLRGAHRAMPKSHYLPNLKQWFSTIEVEVLEPIPTTNYDFESRHELIQLTRERFLAALGQESANS